MMPVQRTDHKDPPAYHAILGASMYGTVEMRLLYPVQGVDANMQRLEPLSLYLMAGQAATFCEHAVTAPLTPEGRCVVIVRFITKDLFKRMKKDMEKEMLGSCGGGRA